MPGRERPRAKIASVKSAESLVESTTTSPVPLFSVTVTVYVGGRIVGSAIVAPTYAVIILRATRPALRPRGRDAI